MKEPKFGSLNVCGDKIYKQYGCYLAKSKSRKYFPLFIWPKWSISVVQQIPGTIVVSVTVTDFCLKGFNKFVKVFSNQDKSVRNNGLVFCNGQFLPE